MEGENDKVRVMFGGEIVLAVQLKFCRKPGGYNARSLKDLTWKAVYISERTMYLGTGTKLRPWRINFIWLLG